MSDNEQLGGYATTGGCQLRGIPLGNGRYLQNLGVIILCGIAIVTTLVLLYLAQRKRAAVGRRYVLPCAQSINNSRLTIPEGKCNCS